MDNDNKRKIVQFYPMTTFGNEIPSYMTVPLYLNDSDAPMYRLGVALLDTGELATVFANGIANYRVFTKKDWKLYRAYNQMACNLQPEA